jgi:hypothetical protein
MTNAKGTRTTQRNVLSLPQNYALGDILKAKYTESGLSSQEFAESINNTPSMREQFKFDLNSHHIANALKALDIPTNFARRRPASIDAGECLGLTVRVQELEEQMQKLTAYVKTLRK